VLEQVPLMPEVYVPAADLIAGNLKLSPVPGIYAIKAAPDAEIPGVFGRHLSARGTGVLYIGQTTDSLQLRCVEQELLHRSPGTMFRSLGAILGAEVESPSGRRSDGGNYRFTAQGKARIRRWLERFAFVGVLTEIPTRELSARENALISSPSVKPILNCRPQDPYRIEDLVDLRKACRRRAMGSRLEGG
jgi:hypothetical protein